MSNFILEDDVLALFNSNKGKAPEKTPGQKLADKGGEFIRAASAGEGKELATVLSTLFPELIIKERSNTTPLFKHPVTGETSARAGTSGKQWLNDELEANGGIKSRFINRDRKDFDEQVEKYRIEEIKDKKLTLENAQDGDERTFVTNYLAQLNSNSQ